MRLFLYLLLFFYTIGTQCQELKQKYELSFNAGRGFIIAHSPTMLYLSQDHLNNYRLDLEFKNFGDKNWQRIYPGSNYGLEVNYFDFNNSMLGQGFSVAHYLTFKVINGKKFNINFKPILGMGLISNPFDAIENTKNIAIGSHLNIFVALGLCSKFELSKNWKLSSSIRFNHFSNTGFKLPNLGINIPSINLGLVRSIPKTYKSTADQPNQNYVEGNSIEISSAVGINQVASTQNNFYFNQYGSINYLKINNVKSRYVIGVDYFYTPGNQKALEIDSIYRSNSVNQQLALSIGHDLVISNVSFRTQLGFYVYNRNVSRSNMYYKVGGNLFINRKLHPFFGLKTHNAKAEYFFVGLRYQIKYE